MLRIMTLNLNYDDPKRGPWPTRRQLIVEAIRAANPDVVALQAVAMPRGGEDQARQLAAALPEYQPMFEAADPAVDGGFRGSAWLARVPLSGPGVLLLSRQWDHEDRAQRLVLHTQCRSAAGALNVFNAHLSWVPRQTADNVRELLPYLDAFHGASVLVGDFNAQPDSAELAPLAEDGWIDAWAALRGSEPGPTFDAAEPRLRIDQVWVNAPAQRRLASVELVANARDPSGAWASDHLGLLVSLEDQR